MSPADFRSLITASGLSNREAAEALSVDDRRVRRFKSGEDEIPATTADRLAAVAAEALAAQMIRSLNLAAGGHVELAKLTISESAINVESELSPPVARAVRAAILTRLAEAGLKIERENK